MIVEHGYSKSLGREELFIEIYSIHEIRHCSYMYIFIQEQLIYLSTNNLTTQFKQTELNGKI